jgi:hypothetical protein
VDDGSSRVHDSRDRRFDNSYHRSGRDAPQEQPPRPPPPPPADEYYGASGAGGYYDDAIEVEEIDSYSEYDELYGDDEPDYYGDERRSGYKRYPGQHKAGFPGGEIPPPPGYGDRRKVPPPPPDDDSDRRSYPYRQYRTSQYGYKDYPVQSFWDQMGFYNLIWDPRYNVKIPVMQIIAICSLILIFNLNYLINFEFVKQLGNFSPYILGQPPQVAWIFALILSLFISVFPKMDKEFRMTITLGLIVIVIIFFLAGPLVALIGTRDMLQVGTALANSLVAFLKVLTVLVYWAPILLGVYGIIARNRVYLFISVLFFLAVIITTDLYFLSIQEAHTKTDESIPMFIVFALSLLCYYEMSDSSITFYQLNETTRRREHYSPHQQHLERII